VSALHLYVHIPYCLHKCPYCDFNSHEQDPPPWRHYQRALLCELAHWAEHPSFAGCAIGTVFFGGGTPSLAPPALIHAVLEAVDLRFGLKKDAEITLEANPGSVDIAYFEAYRACGINRLSLGVQSFSKAELVWLERIHDDKDAIRACESARRAGFTRLNLDMMYGLPNQSVDHWLDDLDTAIRLAPEHLSCYQLTIEPHTQLALRHKKKPLALPDEGDALEFLMQTRTRLEAAGYRAYEISNFSHPGGHCRHNDGYWQYHDYIGIGAGAAGKWDTPNGGVIRYGNIRSPGSYIKSALETGCAIHSREKLSAVHAAAEFVWLGLRRTDGVSRPRFYSRFGFDIHELFASPLNPWEKTGHLERTNTRFKLTTKGLSLADSIAASVLQSALQAEATNPHRCTKADI